MNQDEILPYCRARLNELKVLLSRGDAWGFLCIAAYIDFLSKLVEGEDTKSDGYKLLVESYFPEKYRTFTYGSGKVDLYYQMYHIFRCGLIHTLSLYPDHEQFTKPGGKYQGRPRSVLLTHDGLSSDGRFFPHLSHYNENGIDAAVIHANDLFEDVRAATETALATPNLRVKARAWVSLSPPIGVNCM